MPFDPLLPPSPTHTCVLHTPSAPSPPSPLCPPITHSLNHSTTQSPELLLMLQALSHSRLQKRSSAPCSTASSGAAAPSTALKQLMQWRTRGELAPPEGGGHSAHTQPQQGQRVWVGGEGGGWAAETIRTTGRGSQLRMCVQGSAVRCITHVDTNHHHTARDRCAVTVYQNSHTHSFTACTTSPSLPEAIARFPRPPQPVLTCECLAVAHQLLAAMGVVHCHLQQHGVSNSTSTPQQAE